jgi:hypothetical protein
LIIKINTKDVYIENNNLDLIKNSLTPSGVNKKETITSQDKFKIKGLNLDEIMNLNSGEYSSFIKGLTEKELDMLPGKYDISEYISFETNNFIINDYDLDTKELKIKSKTNNQAFDEENFEYWYKNSVENNRNEIKVIWSK